MIRKHQDQAGDLMTPELVDVLAGVTERQINPCPLLARYVVTYIPMMPYVDDLNVIHRLTMSVLRLRKSRSNRRVV